MTSTQIPKINEMEREDADCSPNPLPSDRHLMDYDKVCLA